MVDIAKEKGMHLYVSTVSRSEFDQRRHDPEAQGQHAAHTQ